MDFRGGCHVSCLYSTTVEPYRILDPAVARRHMIADPTVEPAMEPAEPRHACGLAVL
jgi:hypothetical protein